jgi:multimeric flavodoxin WrbA
MKTTVLNGLGHNDHGAQAILDLFLAELTRRRWPVSHFALRECRITHCRGCFECWTKRPGICKFEDDGPAIARAVIDADVLVFFTPVTFGGYSSHLKKALDRIIGLILPFFTTIDGETHHQKRYDRYPRLVSIGTLPQPDPSSEAVFTSLVQRNALNLRTKAVAEVYYLDGSLQGNQRQRLQSLIANLEANP